MIKLVRESLNFDRGQDPKAAMEIGGVNLDQMYTDMVRVHVTNWFKFLDSLKGKSVTFYLDETEYLSKVTNRKIKIRVSDYGFSLTNGKLKLHDTNGTIWHVDMEKTIYIGKPINEKFDRHQDPKRAMKIGIINLEEFYQETVLQNMNKWEEFLNSLLGKTITFTSENVFDKQKTAIIRRWDYDIRFWSGDSKYDYKLVFYTDEGLVFRVDLTKPIIIE